MVLDSFVVASDRDVTTLREEMGAFIHCYVAEYSAAIREGPPALDAGAPGILEKLRIASRSLMHPKGVADSRAIILALLRDVCGLERVRCLEDEAQAAGFVRSFPGLKAVAPSGVGFEFSGGTVVRPSLRGKALRLGSSWGR